MRQQLPYTTTLPTQTHVRNTGIQLRTSVQKGLTCCKLHTTASGLQRIGNGGVSIAAMLRSLIQNVLGLSIRITYILPVIFLICSIRMPSQPPCIPHLMVVGSQFHHRVQKKKTWSLESSRNNSYLARVMSRVTSRFLLQFIVTLFLKIVTARNIRLLICKRPLH